MTHSSVNNLSLDLLIHQKKIKERLSITAKELDKLYGDEEVILLMILKGSLFLVADLMRLLHFPIHLECIQCMSYGDRGIQKGDLKIIDLETLTFKDKHVLLIDDIFDTGETLGEVYKMIENQNPLSLHSLVLLTKDVPRKTDYRPDFSLFDIEDRFVVGYGLDYKESYRELPDIYAINP